MDAAFSAFVSIAFHGIAFAMVLYLVSVGLSVTMGLMGFANLAHGRAQFIECHLGSVGRVRGYSSTCQLSSATSHPAWRTA